MFGQIAAAVGRGQAHLSAARDGVDVLTATMGDATSAAALPELLPTLSSKEHCSDPLPHLDPMRTGYGGTSPLGGFQTPIILGPD